MKKSPRERASEVLRKSLHMEAVLEALKRKLEGDTADHNGEGVRDLEKI